MTHILLPDDAANKSRLLASMLARVMPETRQISIRLAAADLVTASRLASVKGLPYQTYIKSLLHEALESERKRLGQ